ncbi:hypothetical protein D9M68_227090 [compost metagenome]
MIAISSITNDCVQTLNSATQLPRLSTLRAYRLLVAPNGDHSTIHRLSSWSRLIRRPA